MFHCSQIIRFVLLSLKETTEVDNLLIFFYSSFYTRFRNVIINCQPVNNSYKWAGGGLLSNVMDLNKFGNAMLYSLQATQHKIGEISIVLATRKYEMCQVNKVYLLL